MLKRLPLPQGHSGLQENFLSKEKLFAASTRAGTSLGQNGDTLLQNEQ